MKNAYRQTLLERCISFCFETLSLFLSFPFYFLLNKRVGGHALPPHTHPWYVSDIYGVFYKFQCGTLQWVLSWWMRDTLRIGEHISISPLTKKQVTNHLLFCNHLASYGDFNILTREKKKLYYNWKTAC